MLQSIRDFLKYVYELIFGSKNNKKKKYVYDREYKEYQKAFASKEYIEDDYGNEYSDDGDDFYPPYYYDYDGNYDTHSLPLNKRTQLRKRRIRRKKILKKPPFIKPEES
uniref:Plasmodium yoelii subtelomeric region (PYST-C1) n=1 Tax=Strongyloides stercoralis TaxID=6248 RepID=A0A0K0E236_STRER